MKARGGLRLGNPAARPKDQPVNDTLVRFLKDKEKEKAKTWIVTRKVANEDVEFFKESEETVKLSFDKIEETKNFRGTFQKVEGSLGEFGTFTGELFANSVYLEVKEKRRTYTVWFMFSKKEETWIADGYWDDRSGFSTYKRGWTMKVETPAKKKD